ncbi:TetR/AcrR family transcriptional regulator [Streptomyces sp. NPDC051940]|uniref:TetR/AcrR family transcriptional regulator n=1 Tax=Streptomyces sp. NPDC051940 TaxID=3155675 RepID=UPI0034166E9A
MGAEVNDDPAAAAAPRGRPRNAAVDREVVDTVLRLLADGVGFADLSMVAIAREAGVTRATVYRRWPTKDALLLDVVTSVERPLPEPAGRSVREDLVGALEATRQRVMAKHVSALMRNMLTYFQSSPELWRRYREVSVAPRREAFTRLLRRGIEEGQIRAELGDDMDFLIDMLISPMYYRASMDPDAVLEDDLAERIVDAFLLGTKPR